MVRVRAARPRMGWELDGRSATGPALAARNYINLTFCGIQIRRVFPVYAQIFFVIRLYPVTDYYSPRMNHIA